MIVPDCCFPAEADRTRGLPRAPIRKSDLDCQFLSTVGRCLIYDDRPLICRLYGVVEDMRCDHECVPEEGLMTSAAARALMESARVAKP